MLRMMGWRFWIIVPGEYVLRSPYDPTITWPGPTLKATCTINPQHMPPAPDCECGVYAEANAGSLIRRMKAWRISLPPRQSRGVHIVIGRVQLTNVVPSAYRSTAMASLPPLRTWPYELRAELARMSDLMIIDGPALTPDQIGELHTGLEAAYGCLVTPMRTAAGPASTVQSAANAGA